MQFLPLPVSRRASVEILKRRLVLNFDWSHGSRATGVVVAPTLKANPVAVLILDIGRVGPNNFVSAERRNQDGNQIQGSANPFSISDPATPGTRRLSKDSGETRHHHDRGFADVDGDARDELASMTQRANPFLLFEIPADQSQFCAMAIYGFLFVDVWFEPRGGTNSTADLIDDSQSFGWATVSQADSGRTA